MGAQVHNQMIQRVHQSPAPPRMKTSMRPAPSRVNRIKCNLFGKVESTALKQFVDQQMKEQNEAKSKKWGFDFMAGRPLENSAMEWKPVQPADVPIVPTMITLIQAAHIIPTNSRPVRRTHNSEKSGNDSLENLLDERAERENDRSSSGVEDTLNDSFTSTSTLSPASVVVANSEESDSEPNAPCPVPRSSARILQRQNPQQATPASSSKLRQPQITEFLKERKRPSSFNASRDGNLAKKIRSSLGNDNASTSAASSN